MNDDSVIEWYDGTGAPFDIVRYNAHLHSLLGEAVSSLDPFPINQTVDLILRLAIIRQAETIEFTVTSEDALGVRMLSNGDWLALPSLPPVGSALSRLLIVGGLNKGADARSQSQCNTVSRDGVELLFEASPVRQWRENIVIHLSYTDAPHGLHGGQEKSFFYVFFADVASADGISLVQEAATQAEAIQLAKGRILEANPSWKLDPDWSRESERMLFCLASREIASACGKAICDHSGRLVGRLEGKTLDQLVAGILNGGTPIPSPGEEQNQPITDEMAMIKGGPERQPKGPFLVMAFRYGMAEQGFYPFLLTADYDAAVEAAGKMREFRGQKHQCAVYSQEPSISGKFALLYYTEKGEEPAWDGLATGSDQAISDAFQNALQWVQKTIKADLARANCFEPHFIKIIEG